jgi:hypothetical protein
VVTSDKIGRRDFLKSVAVTASAAMASKPFALALRVLQPVQDIGNPLDRRFMISSHSY